MPYQILSHNPTNNLAALVQIPRSFEADHVSLNAEVMFCFKVHLQLAWYHVIVSQLYPTDDALWLSAVEIPGLAEATRQAAFVILFL